MIEMERICSVCLKHQTDCLGDWVTTELSYEEVQKRLNEMDAQLVAKELGKIMKRLDDAFAKYDKTHDWRDARYVDGLLDITEELVANLQKIAEEKREKQ